jgi:hypothetical protein
MLASTHFSTLFLAVFSIHNNITALHLKTASVSHPKLQKIKQHNRNDPVINFLRSPMKLLEFPHQK